MNIKEKLDRVLSFIYPDLQLLQDDYFIIGAAALILAGIPIMQTSDIDILTSERDAMLLQNVWKDKEIKEYAPSDSNLFRSSFARFHFEPLAVEVMGGLNIKRQGRWTTLVIKEYSIISGSGFHVKIPVLSEQKNILALFGRQKDFDKIALIDKHAKI